MSSNEQNHYLARLPTTIEGIPYTKTGGCNISTETSIAKEYIAKVRFVQSIHAQDFELTGIASVARKYYRIQPHLSFKRNELNDLRGSSLVQLGIDFPRGFLPIE